MNVAGREVCWISALVFSIGCTARSPSSPDGGRAISATEPPSLASLPTTSGELTESGFRGQLELEWGFLDAGAHTTHALQALSSLLQAEAQFFGKLDDYDLALKLSEELVRAVPDEADAHLVRAGVLASLHRFEEALTEASEARKHGAGLDQVDVQRAAIFQAQGRYDDSLPLYERLISGRPATMTLGAAAGSFAEVHDPRAEQLFVDAEHSYRDVSPFPVAWLEFQQGLRWEKEGQTSRAKAFYADAIARLPGYAPATGHLAALEAATGHRDQGLERLRALVVRSDDPEYLGQLSALLAEAGLSAEAATVRATAAARFDLLVARHPAAFADHAARFWLSAGKDPRRALTLARLNLEGRSSIDAYDLALTAALTAKDAGQACVLAQRAAALKRSTPHLEFLIQQARQGCAPPSP